MASQDSLSVVLAVHNAEQSLAAKISKLLDLLPDLTRKFEILIIDDGSRDHTAEIAHEFAREYPQVQVVERLERGDRNETVEIALRRTSGDFIFVQDESEKIDSTKFKRLWELRQHGEIQVPVQRMRSKPNVMKRLAAWGIQIQDTNRAGHSSGLQMLKRESTATTPIFGGTAGRLSRVDTAEAGWDRRTREAAPFACRDEVR